jgi:carbamoyltransferase
MIDGDLVYSIQEERLVYEKNASGWPELSIARTLAFAGLKPEQIDHIGLSSRHHFLRKRSPRDHTRIFKSRLSIPGIAYDFAKNAAAEVLHFPGRRLAQLTIAGFDPARATFVDHHLCHAAAAYHGLRQERSKPYLVFTLDGAGDELCASISIGKDDKLERRHTTHYYHSLGALYSTLTFLMGFEPMEHEYKLMGMAAYADPKQAERAAKIFERYLAVDDANCTFRRLVPEPIFQIARRMRRDIAGFRFDHLCAGMQLATERLMIQWVRSAVARYGIRSILCGGGVFMNVKANKLLAELPEIDDIDVFPSCGDETNPIGACYAIHTSRFESAPIPVRTMYLGDAVCDADVETELGRRALPYRRVENIECVTARLLADGEAVARVKGRLELGARALCNRSILADPSNQDNVRLLNQAVKKRDFWMPFAPVMMEEDHERYLVNPKHLKSPYMMLAFDTRDNFRELIAAVHNVDLSARAQILRKGENPEMERLLEEFKRVTGRAALLNTSYNLHGYPICLGAKEALDVFETSGLKYLALNNYLVTKQG